jgi:hypothetical protein
MLLGIWIKSQNKGLYRCHGFDAPARRDNAPENKPYGISGVVANDYTPWLGWYATEERALQVINMIENHIHSRENDFNLNLSMSGRDNGYATTWPVFEMPAE